MAILYARQATYCITETAEKKMHSYYGTLITFVCDETDSAILPTAGLHSHLILC